MRVAPAAFADEAPFRLGCESAAITHGHPSGYLAAGFFAAVVRRCLKGHRLQTAIVRTCTELKAQSRHRECLAAVERALDLAVDGAATPERVEALGGGWVAEEALAIALYCALTARDFRDGVLQAVNHSGDSDSTGAMTGNLLGAMLGSDAIPAAWLEQLELRDVIEQVGLDLFRHFGSQSRPALDDVKRYPPW